MAEANEVPLNEEFDSPSVPPDNRYRNRGRETGCCGISCCILSIAVKIIIITIIVAFIGGLIFTLVVHPTNIKIYVEEASLTEFNLTRGKVLHYNLTAEVSIRNPNKKISIYYDSLVAAAYYSGERFCQFTYPSFHQGCKNTTTMYPEFVGQNSIPLEGSDGEDFDKEKKKGAFHILVRIHARLRFKLGSFKTFPYKPDVQCELKLPLRTDGSESINSSIEFMRTKCNIDL